MEEKKKKFLKPELEVIDFKNDDIITGSGEGLLEGIDKTDWDNSGGETEGY